MADFPRGDQSVQKQEDGDSTTPHLHRKRPDNAASSKDNRANAQITVATVQNSRLFVTADRDW